MEEIKQEAGGGLRRGASHSEGLAWVPVEEGSKFRGEGACPTPCTLDGCVGIGGAPGDHSLFLWRWGEGTLKRSACVVYAARREPG